MFLIHVSEELVSTLCYFEGVHLARRPCPFSGQFLVGRGDLAAAALLGPALNKSRDCPTLLSSCTHSHIITVKRQCEEAAVVGGSTTGKGCKGRRQKSGSFGWYVLQSR